MNAKAAMAWIIKGEILQLNSHLTSIFIIGMILALSKKLFN